MALRWQNLILVVTTASVIISLKEHVNSILQSLIGLMLLALAMHWVLADLPAGDAGGSVWQPPDPGSALFHGGTVLVGLYIMVSGLKRAIVEYRGRKRRRGKR